MRLIVPIVSLALLGASAPPLSQLDGVEPRKLGAANEIDRMTTGRTVNMRQRKAWKKLRNTYRKCPSCLAQQPFPLEPSEVVRKRPKR